MDNAGNGRRSGGFSLRRMLENQGVTTEDEMRKHLDLAYVMTKVVPLVNLTRYRPQREK
jgi:hypothetical protein